MNVLEKILKEIEERVNFRERLVKYEKRRGTVTDVCRNKGALEELDIVAEIIRSHMDEAKNDDWIPYTEQNIPKKEGIYLVTCDDKEYPVKRMRFKENLWYWYYGIYDGRILAWQPLPEQYRGDSNA